MKYLFSVINLILFNSIFSYSQIDSKNYKGIIGNNDWLINGHTINDSFVKNSNETFFSFKDSSYFWLSTENSLQNLIKDTNALSGGTWRIDSNNRMVLEEHLVNGMWFELIQRFWIYKISYGSKDSIKLIPTIHPFMEILLTRMPQLNYAKPKFTNSNRFIWPPSISYWNLKQHDLKILPKNKKKTFSVPVGEILTIWTSNDTNTNFSDRYTGNLFTCDSQNIYLRLQNKYQSWLNDDNTLTKVIYEYPWNFDTILYPNLKCSSIEKIPYKNIFSMEYGRISPEFSSATLMVSLLSLTSSLIIAPLCSYNFKSGNFNQKRYYKILIPSLITLSVSLPLTFFAIRNEDRFLKNGNKDLVFKPMK